MPLASHEPIKFPDICYLCQGSGMIWTLSPVVGQPDKMFWTFVPCWACLRRELEARA